MLFISISLMNLWYRCPDIYIDRLSFQIFQEFKSSGSEEAAVAAAHRAATTVIDAAAVSRSVMLCCCGLCH